MSTRKAKGNLHNLPWLLRLQINERLRDGRHLRPIAEWLWDQTVPEEIPELDLKAGDKIGLIWLDQDRLAKLPQIERERALHCAVNALSRYRASSDFMRWLTEDRRDQVTGQLISNFAALTGSAQDDSRNALDEARGLNRLLLSIVAEKIEKLTNGDANTGDVSDMVDAANKLLGRSIDVEESLQARKKLELAEKKMAEAKSAVDSEQLSAEQKESRLREIFGMAS